MTPENFCFWLQGFFEISQHIDHRQGLTSEAVEEIRNHLKTVFVKVTPEIRPSLGHPGFIPGVLDRAAIC